MSEYKRAALADGVSGMGVMEAIYKRRAVRNFTPEILGPDVIRHLTAAAVQAPTAMHEEPWLFTIIQNKEILRELSDSAKRHFKKDVKPDSRHTREALALLEGEDFNIFYNASTLIVIWAKPAGPFASADCWLAAQNLMLAACAHGLGTCVIGFALSALNTAAWRRKLGLHEKMVAVAPVIVGVPVAEPPPVPRKAPEIIQCD